MPELAPRPAQPEQWTPAEQEAAPKPRRGIRFGGQKVLIVDDDIRNVFALTSVLEQHGLSVLYFYTTMRTLSPQLRVNTEPSRQRCVTVQRSPHSPRIH
ncbi:hypothetical protein SVIOM74S_05118 [Streptomyces violarus]